MTKVAIHQPNFLPWLGYLYKIHLCDIFVILDDVQYIRNSYINRCYIKTVDNPEFLLTLPLQKHSSRALISELKISKSKEYFNILKTISRNYKKAIGFCFFDELVGCFNEEKISLVEFNVNLIERLCKVMAITKPFIFASSLDIKENGQERIINIVKALNCKTYLSGQGAKSYQDEKKFLEEGINLEYLNYHFPKYTQLWGSFQPNLSAIDYILNTKKSDLTFK